MRPRYPKNRPAARTSLPLILTDLPYMMFVLSGIFIMLGIFYPSQTHPKPDFFQTNRLFPVFYLQLYAIKQGIREKIAFDTVRCSLAQRFV
jgi:hypothetical protein